MRAQFVEDLHNALGRRRYTVTKTSTQHIVPLSRQAVEILRELKNQATRFSRARSRVIHARAAFEPPLKTLRIFAEIMHETGERRSSRGTKLLAPNAPQFCNSREMIV